MTQKFSVVLSAGNISHYHHAALALQEAGYLQKYYTTFNGNESGWFYKLLPANYQLKLRSKEVGGLNPALIETFPFPYIFSQMLRNLKVLNDNQTNFIFGNYFDYLTRKKIQYANVFHFVETLGLESARNFKNYGTYLICDVRSPHIDVQEKALIDEYEKLGLKFQSRISLLRDKIIHAYSIADKIIAPSTYVANSFISQGFAPEKIRIIPYGANFGRLKFDVVKKDREKFRILFVGSIIPRKGVHYLIKAFTRLKIKNAELHLVGRSNPDYKKYLDKLASGNTAIKFIGHIPQQVLATFYQTADIFVLPSLSEGSALVIYEAMAYGLPVIVSENSGSVIQDGVEGYISQVGNVSELQEKILRLYENEVLRNSMGQAAQTSIQNYSWSSYRARIKNFYEELRN